MCVQKKPSVPFLYKRLFQTSFTKISRKLTSHVNTSKFMSHFVYNTDKSSLNNGLMVRAHQKWIQFFQSNLHSKTMQRCEYAPSKANRLIVTALILLFSILSCCRHWQYDLVLNIFNIKSTWNLKTLDDYKNTPLPRFLSQIRW